MAFIVGGLVVAVAVIAYLFWGGATDPVVTNDLENAAETAGGTIEDTAETTGAVIENSAESAAEATEEAVQ
jgi:hypothetical protein